MEGKMEKPRVTFLPPDPDEFWPTIRVRIDIGGNSYGITADGETSMYNIWATVERVITDSALRKHMDMFRCAKL